MSWLTNHYRMHPHLAAVTLSFMYRDILSHPRPFEEFLAPFSDIQGPSGLSFVTVVDTRLSQDRYKGSRGGQSGGQMYNDL